MNERVVFDEDLVRRLPLPLAKLYRRAHIVQTPFEQYLTAYYLWEAALKLLSSLAIVEYAQRGEHDARVAERLTKLAKPALGDWWAFARLLVPLLADADDPGFAAVRQLLLGGSREDLPRAAGLDAALREALDGAAQARTTVRLSELFDRIVKQRNRELGHGAAGQRDKEFYRRLGPAMLAGVAEILTHCDVLAGRRLVGVTDVRRRDDGHWQVAWLEVRGEGPQPLPAWTLPPSAAAALPLPGRLYAVPERLDDGGPSRLCCLHPLVICGDEFDEILFLNSRRGRSRTEYLCYSSGATEDRDDLRGEQRVLLGRILDYPVEPQQLEQWTADAEAEEPVQAETPQLSRRCIGEFELLSKLGQGGMGVVYRAWQPSLGRQVALKKLARVGDPKSDARFAREIKILGRVEHPHLVKIFTSGSDADEWFYAMELIEGATLGAIDEKLRSRSASAADLDLHTWQDAVSTVCEETRQSETPLSDPGDAGTRPARSRAGGRDAAEELPDRGYVRHVAALVRQAAEAAHALHVAGAVHRDIKPGNIMVAADGAHAVLMDLGLAQLTDETEGKLTRTRQFVGTLRYASPEQVLAVRRLDGRSDVYSLGATLWELLTLRPMFGAGDDIPTPELMSRIQYAEPEPIRRYNRRVPADLDAIVVKCLEKDPQRRYATAAALADDLRQFLAGEAVRARPIGPLRRTLRRVRRRPRATLELLLAGVAVVCVALGVVYWDTHLRTKIEYCRGFVMRLRAPEPYGSLSAVQTRHRAVSWRVTRRGDRVEKLEAINAAGDPTVEHSQGAYLSRDADAKRECSYAYRYDEQGGAVEEAALDRDGRAVWTFHYVTPTTGYYADARGFARSPAGTGAAYVQFVYDDDGFELEVRYLDKDGKPQPDRDGVYRRRRERNPRGQVTASESRDASDKPVLNRYGYFRIETRYDDRDNEVERVYLGLDGRPTTIKSGYGRSTSTYDDRDNLVERAYLDQEGKPATIDVGYARRSMKYDERGFAVEIAYFDADGNPALEVDGNAIVRWDNDQHGHQTEAAFFDERGRPTRIKSGYAAWTAQYDEHGRMRAKQYLDERQRPTFQKEGYAAVTFTYDERGNQTSVSYLGLDGQPRRSNGGYARWTSEFDEYNRGNKEAFFDEAGKPVLRDGGFASAMWSYDDRGNEIERAYFGPAGEPVTSAQGYSKVIYKYDERGRRVETAFFDPEGEPTLDSNGVASFRLSYDERDNETERKYFDADVKPTLGKDGYARSTSRYDEHGRRAELAYFDADEKPTLHKDGNAKVRWKYDDRGNEIERAYFDRDGAPTKIGDGYARSVRTCDERGRAVREAYFDETGLPTFYKDGYASAAWKRDERGNMIEAVYFDREGGPTTITGGFAKFTAKYDERSYRTEEAFFDEAGAPTLASGGSSRTTWKYDERGNEIERAYFGLSDEPTTVREGYSRWTASYDERGHRSGEAFFDEADQPTLGKDGYASVRRSYDARGNLIEAAFFGPRNEPTTTNYGIARLTAGYDGRGRRIEEAYFDEASDPTLDSDGSSRTTWEYDERGNEIEVAYFGREGEPTITGAGYARWRALYDDRGRLCQKAFFDAVGRPTHRNDGSARVTFQYDDRGDVVEELYFDEWEHPKKVADGYAGIASVFNARGWREKTTYLDEAGQPTPVADGHAKIHHERDDRGRLVEELYLGTDDRPVKTRHGYTRRTAKYDARGNRVEDAFFDELGNPVLFQGECAAIAWNYDRRGNPIEQTYFGLAREPLTISLGYARWVARYDDRGKQIEIAYFDQAKQPTKMSGRYAKATFDYDRRGRRVAEAYFDEAGQPMLDTDRCARATWKYDDRGNKVEEAYFGLAGELVTTTRGYAKWVAECDERGRRTKIAYFGADGLPTHAPDGSHSSWEAQYDDHGRLRQEIFFFEAGLAGGGCARITLDYDETNDVVGRDYRDAQGRPATVRGDYADWSQPFGGHERVVARLYVDRVGKPTSGEFGYAGWTAVYDERGGLSDKTYFGVEGERVPTVIVVREVFPGGAAEKAGLQAADVLVAFDGEQTLLAERLLDTLAAGPSDDLPRSLVVLRKGETLSLQLAVCPLNATLEDWSQPSLPSPKADDETLPLSTRQPPR